MSLIERATELSAIANAPDATYEDAMDAAQAVLVAAEDESANLDGALRVLLAAVRAEDDERAGIGAIVCGALVERGAEASLGTEHIVERFLVVAKTSARYVAACRDYFQDNILSEQAVCEICGPGEEETDIMMPQVRSAVSQEFPAGEAAWIALDLFCRPTVSVLARDPEARRALAKDIEMVNVIGALATHQPGAYFVWALLSMLDDEKLLVFEPTSGAGWEVGIDGVADNFQLHLLLANALIEAGHLDADPPEPEVIEVLNGAGPPMLDDFTMGYWNLYNWTGLSPEGVLPDGYFDQGSQHWIWNEGVPADIRELDGRRLVFLGAAPVIRQWRPARLFEPLPARVTVERSLDEDEVERWLSRVREESAKAREPRDPPHEHA